MVDWGGEEDRGGGGSFLCSHGHGHEHAHDGHEVYQEDQLHDLLAQAGGVYGDLCDLEG